MNMSIIINMSTEPTILCRYARHKILTVSSRKTTFNPRNSLVFRFIPFQIDWALTRIHQSVDRGSSSSNVLNLEKDMLIKSYNKYTALTTMKQHNMLWCTVKNLYLKSEHSCGRWGNCVQTLAIMSEHSVRPVDTTGCLVYMLSSG